MRRLDPAAVEENKRRVRQGQDPVAHVWDYPVPELDPALMANSDFFVNISRVLEAIKLEWGAIELFIHTTPSLPPDAAARRPPADLDALNCARWYAERHPNYEFGLRGLVSTDEAVRTAADTLVSSDSFIALVEAMNTGAGTGWPVDESTILLSGVRNGMLVRVGIDRTGEGEMRIMTTNGPFHLKQPWHLDCSFTNEKKPMLLVSTWTLLSDGKLGDRKDHKGSDVLMHDNYLPGSGSRRHIFDTTLGDVQVAKTIRDGDVTQTKQGQIIHVGTIIHSGPALVPGDLSGGRIRVLMDVRSGRGRVHSKSTSSKPVPGKGNPFRTNLSEALTNMKL